MYRNEVTSCDVQDRYESYISQLVKGLKPSSSINLTEKELL